MICHKRHSNERYKVDTGFTQTSIIISEESHQNTGRLTQFTFRYLIEAWVKEN